MKKTEEELARELDAYLTARLHNRPVRPQLDADRTLTQLADDLLDLAAQTQLDPTAAAAQKAQIARSAGRAQKNKRPAEPTAWSRILKQVLEGVTMKRTGFALGAALALFVMMFAAWFAFTGLGGGTAGDLDVVDSDVVQPTAAVADSGPVDGADNDGGPVDNGTVTDDEETEAGSQVAQVVADDPSTLAPLPSLAGAGGLGSGRGGGGGGGAAESGTVSDSTSMPIFTNPLSGTNYVFNVTLSTDPIAATVYQRPGSASLGLEDLSRFAAALGIGGPVYTVESSKTEAFPGESPFTPYYMFDGARQLTLVDASIYYYDDSLAPMGEINWLPYAEAAPLAEAYLQGRGLLDFPHEMAGFGPEVEFRRLLGGQALLQPEYQISMHESGQPWAIGFNPQPGLTALGNYPLRSQADAWQFFLDTGEIDYQTIFFRTYAGESDAIVEPAPADDPYRYWQRSLSDGDTITFYPYLNVYVPIDGGALPHIVADRYLVQGAADALQALAEQAGTQVSLTGIIRESGRVVELQEWHANGVPEYAFREGVIRRDGDRVLLETTESETILIPNAPADLEDGARVYVDGWAIEPGADLPSFNWQGIGLAVDVASEEPIVSEPIGTETMPAFIAYVINQVTVEQIDLVYVIVPVATEAQMEAGTMPDFILQPVWRFSGTTDGNERIEIFVQAVPDELVSEPAG